MATNIFIRQNNSKKTTEQTGTYRNLLQSYEEVEANVKLIL